MKTISNKWLVEYATAQIGRPYWYGTFGSSNGKALADAQLLAEKKRQYPNYYDQSKYSVKFTDNFGKKVHDCSGLVKGAVFCSDTGVNGAPKYDSTFDKSANSMYEWCTEKGDISNIPEIPGLLVWKENHVGIYVGNGYCVEARGHDYGVQKNKITERGFKKYGKLPFVTYEVTNKYTAEQAMADIRKIVEKYYGQK